jgi:2-methylcitrate dehydratase PrpD
LRTIGEPIEEKRRPKTAYQAQFSGPYTIAAALFGGGGLGLGLDDFTDALTCEPTRRALMDKVDVVEDERCNEIFPRQFPAVLTATLIGGQSLVERVEANRGGPARPLSDAELVTKFRDNARRYLADEDVRRLQEEIMSLPSRTNVRAVLAFAGPRAAVGQGVGGNKGSKVSSDAS